MEWFYMKKSNCTEDSTDSDCVNNKKNINAMKTTSDLLETAKTQYNDVFLLYSRELLFTVNILFGLGLLLYYIYINGNALPNVSEKVTSAVKNISIPSIGKASNAKL
jgi:hypothetical protein